MKQVKQSDNICTVGWRNIWGRFTLRELQIIKKAIPECRLCSTQYTFNYDINHPDKLQHYMNIYPNKPDDWAFYIDYPTQYHDKVWNIIHYY